MKRLRLAVIAAASPLLALTALPTSAGAATITTYSSHGPFADATFTTAPENPVPGVVYEDVAVGGNDIVSTDTGGHVAPFAYVDIQRYKFTKSGTRVDVSYTVAFGQGTDVSFTVDKRLTTASLDATLSGKNCTATACVPFSGGKVTASWTGTGSLVRLHDNSKTMIPGQVVYVSHDRAAYRNATATGTVLGQSFTTTSADIGTDNYRERLLEH